MTCHIELAFMGDYRPVHWEAETLQECRILALKDISDTYLKNILGEAVNRVESSPTVASCSLQGYTPTPYAVTVARYKFDPWLEKITAGYPPHPRVKYPEEVTE
jgi:hypothetical protein